MSAAAGSVPVPGADLASRRASFRRLWGYLLRNRGRYVAGVLATVAYAGSSVAIPLLVGWSIRALVEDLPGAEVGRRAALLAAVTVLRAGLRFASRTQIFNAAREIENQLRNDLFAHLQRLPQSFYAGWRTGDLMSRCVNDLNSLRLLLGPGLLAVIQNPPLYVGVLAAMFAINAKLALLVLVPYPLFVLIARGFGRHMHSANVAVQEGLADLSSQLQESVSGISVVKAYAMEVASQRHFDAAADALYRRHLRLVRVSSAMPAIVSLLPALAMWVVFLVGGRLVLAGDMPIDRFFTFAMYVYELTFPDLHHGLGVRALAARRRGHAARRRGAPHRPRHRGPRRAGVDRGATRRDRVPRPDLPPFGHRAGARAARRPAEGARRERPRGRGARGLRKDDPRLADPTPLRGGGRQCCCWTASTSTASRSTPCAPPSRWCPRTPSSSR